MLNTSGFLANVHFSAAFFTLCFGQNTYQTETAESIPVPKRRFSRTQATYERKPKSINTYDTSEKIQLQFTFYLR